MEAEELSRRVEEILVPLRAGNREEGLRLLAILEEELGLNSEQKEECAKCHVEDSEFCDEVNVALAAHRADAKRLKTDLADALIKEAEAFRLGEKAVLGLMEERDGLRAQLKQAEEANKNLLEEHQALVRNTAVERMEAREEIAALKERLADGLGD